MKRLSVWRSPKDFEYAGLKMWGSWAVVLEESLPSGRDLDAMGTAKYLEVRRRESCNIKWRLSKHRGAGTTCGLCKHHDMKLFRMPEHVPETRYTNVQKQTLPTKYPQGQNRLHMFSCAEVALGNSLARHRVCSPYTYSKSNTYILTHIYLYILTHPYTVGISPLNKSLSSLKLNLVASKLF